MTGVVVNKPTSHRQTGQHRRHQWRQKSRSSFRPTISTRPSISSRKTSLESLTSKWQELGEGVDRRRFCSLLHVELQVSVRNKRPFNKGVL